MRCRVPAIIKRTRVYRGLAVCLLLLTVDYSLLTQPLFGFDRNNVPLKNWGGFSVNRGWIYDALEKVVLAGLADRVLLNTKPLSRVEAARVVAQAVRRVKADKNGDYNHRGYLEELVYQLVEEFGSELGEMGIRTPLNSEALPGFFAAKPVRYAQFGSVFTGNSHSLVNDFGRNVSSGANTSSTLDGRIQVGDFLSFYYQPVFSANGGDYQGRLQSGYGKLTFWNTELLVGRESIWWGPGSRGSMTISNNAFPLDQVRLSSAEPFHLPWILGRLGPIKLSTFVARLGEDRDFPHAMLSGTRISSAPRLSDLFPRFLSRFLPPGSLELGFTRMFQFGGRGHPTPNPGEFLKILFFGAGCDFEDVNDPTCVNNVMSLDATLRIPDVGRYIPIAKDISLYFEFGWDDTLFGLFVPDKPGGIVGTYLTGLFGDPKLDFRFEYTQTSEIQFTHGIYTSGFTNRGSVLSHFVGTDGNEIYTRTSRSFSPDLSLGISVSRAKIGSTKFGDRGTPKEKRKSFGIDLSYRISDRYSLFLKYVYARVENRGFVPSEAENDNSFRFEFTRKFGK